jgi:hypothetical protein
MMEKARRQKLAEDINTDKLASDKLNDKKMEVINEEQKILEKMQSII